MPRKVHEILKEVGDKPIFKISLGQVPVQAAMLFFLNLVSKGQFAKKIVELVYDEIYDNYVLITIQSDKTSSTVQNIIGLGKDSFVSKVYKFDKAACVRLKKPTYPDEFEDIFDISFTPGKTLPLN